MAKTLNEIFARLDDDKANRALETNRERQKNKKRLNGNAANVRQQSLQSKNTMYTTKSTTWTMMNLLL